MLWFMVAKVPLSDTVFPFMSFSLTKARKGFLFFSFLFSLKT